MSQKTLDFNVQNVPLEGKNLIEASAGTGKTYSIAIMVLRLLLEKDIHINEILMVTFTKAAVAELEERIRKFIRLAHRFANDESIDDEVIKSVVLQAEKYRSKEEIKQKLHSAVINLDETAVMTIHGFCQQTLNEFAFETNQLFNAELVQDMSGILEEATQEFWRKYITGIREDLLELVLQKELSIPGIVDSVKSHLDGKIYHKFDSEITYSFDEEDQDSYLQAIQEAKEKADQLTQELVEEIQSNREDIVSKCEMDRYAKNAFLPFVDQPEAFIKILGEKKETRYTKKLFWDLLEIQEELTKHQEIIDQEIEFCVTQVYCFAIQEITAAVEKKKMTLNQMSFDDMIVNMHKSLHAKHSNPEKQRLQKDLIRGLQWKYKAVFIDEFQDTDRLQYEIFHAAFAEKSILFFIGDPKQSIYAWRKADIDTYFEAKSNVHRIYSMQTNFRSSENLVNALNVFFLPNESFDTFHYQNEKDSENKKNIEYIRVVTPKSAKKKELFYDDAPVVPISVSIQKNKKDIISETAAQISVLLNDSSYRMFGRRIKPSDIGVLVRSKREGNEIKERLAQIAIPAVTVTEARILESHEAGELVYILDAILNHSRANVNRALTTTFINWNPENILRLDEDAIIDKFRNYLLKWQKNGIYSALTDFINGFQLQQNLLARHSENGERILTNLYHLLEVLHKVETRQHFGPEEVIDWLRINRSKNESAEDEMIQRIESDEEAVRIVTIHSSKGLEYNIVFAPFLDFVEKFKKDDLRIVGIRNKKEEYISIKKNKAEGELKELYLLQSEQENRRLVYVALTRAVGKCFIYRSTANYHKGSTLEYFLKALDFEKTRGIIEETEPLNIENPAGYKQETAAIQQDLIAENFVLQHPNWTQTSYSRLAAQPEYILRENFKKSEGSYDDFVFRELVKGAKTGNFIHHIFENIDFSDSEKWEFVIERAIGRFVPDKMEPYSENLQHFLQHVLHAEIHTDSEVFRLSEISSSELLHEMEFDFPMELFKTKTLENLKEAGIAIKSSEEYPFQIEGIMTGFVDLFFRHNGKFYVLDWKTNYLGPSVEDYTSEKLGKAMTASNYHLQYLIYTYAVNLYLSHRLGENFEFSRDFGGVLYLFVRGMRTGKNTGIYFAKPSLEQLSKMEEIFGK